MANRVKVKLESRGMASLLKDAGVRADLTARMKRAEAAAKASAPSGGSGEYARSIRIVQDTTDRAAVRLVTSAPHGAVVEANTGNLARALDAAGGAS